MLHSQSIIVRSARRKRPGYLEIGALNPIHWESSPFSACQFGCYWYFLTFDLRSRLSNPQASHVTATQSTQHQEVHPNAPPDAWDWRKIGMHWVCLVNDALGDTRYCMILQGIPKFHRSRSNLEVLQVSWSVPWATWTGFLIYRMSIHYK